MSQHGRKQAGKKRTSAPPPKPTALRVLPENIPAELKARKQFIPWKYFFKSDSRKGWTKPPYDLATGHQGDATDPNIWHTFDVVFVAYQAGGWDGLGFVMAADRPREDGLLLFGIDLDGCLNPDTGEVSPWALEIVERLATYVEVSPSRRGLRLFVWSKPLPCRSAKGGRRCGPFEVYWGLHFVSLTGHKPPGLPSTATIQDRTDELLAVYLGMFSGDPEGKTADGELDYELNSDVRNPDLSPDRVLEILAGFKDERGAKVRRLIKGDLSDFGDDWSAADASLVNFIVWVVGDDEKRINEVMRKTKLHRAKWSDRADYRWMTIRLAMRGREDFYKPGKRPPPDPEAPDGADPRLGAVIIRDYFVEVYRPTFRRGTAVFSDRYGRDVTPGEATFGPTLELLRRLGEAADAPRSEDGRAVPSRLPRFFSTYSRTAWAEMHKDLPEEEEAAEVAAGAEERFKARLMQLLLTLVTLGERVSRPAPRATNGESVEFTQTERRTLVDWARRFAKDGPWSDVRGHQLWCRVEDDCLALAIHHALTAQVPGFGDLAALGPKRFARLCSFYKLGQSGDESRIRGRRVIRLDPAFVDEVACMPVTEEVADSVADPVADSGASASQDGETVADSEQSAGNRQRNRQEETAKSAKGNLVLPIGRSSHVGAGACARADRHTGNGQEGEGEAPSDTG